MLLFKKRVTHVRRSYATKFDFPSVLKSSQVDWLSSHYHHRSFFCLHILIYISILTEKWIRRWQPELIASNGINYVVERHMMRTPELHSIQKPRKTIRHKLCQEWSVHKFVWLADRHRHSFQEWRFVLTQHRFGNIVPGLATCAQSHQRFTWTCQGFGCKNKHCASVTSSIISLFIRIKYS